MKKRHITTLELYAKTVRLRTAEKRALRERLVSYMEYHPSRVSLREVDQPAIESPLSTLSTETFFRINFTSWQFRAFSGAFAFVLLVGVPYIAERSVPGDMLYKMKVNVNEEVKASLAWTPAERIAWEAERVERRIAEARLLAKEGNLTSETEAAIALTVREHAENVSREIAELRTTDIEGAEVAQVAFESTLEVQTAILDAEAASTTASTAIDSFAASVEQVKQGVSAHDPSFEGIPYERMSALLESETTRARELFTTISPTVTPDERLDIERRLLDIERSMSEARIMQETGRAPKAREVQRALLADIQKLVSFMTDIDVRSSLTLESIVPKKLTDDERLAVVSAELERLKNDAVLITEGEELITDEEILAKYRAGLADLAAMLVAIETFRSEAKHEEALLQVSQASALALDLLGMKERALAPEPLPEPGEGEVIETPEAENASTTASTTEQTTE